MKIDTEGVYTLRYTAEDECGNVTVEERTVVVKSASTVYGAQWDGSSTTKWVRTDGAANFADPQPAVDNGAGSSPFDNIMPWSGMVKTEDADAGTLVAIPKYWYKWTRDGASMKLQIANGATPGFLVSPAHADRGDGKGERDVVYVGRYHCSSADYKSTSGVMPKVSVTSANFRTSIHALGNDIWQYDFAMYWTIAMLYLVEFADWNSQNAIGYGCSPSGSKFNMGATDAMQHHTGTTAAARTEYGSVQYRNIEGLWDNVRDWCDGIYFNGADVFCISNPAEFSDVSGGTKVGERATGSNYISGYTDPNVSGFEYALYPNAVAGSENTYICDRCYYTSSGVVLYVGGGYGRNQGNGLFYFSGNVSASVTSGDIGSRLQRLP